MRRRAAPSAKGPRVLEDGKGDMLWDSIVELFMGERLYDPFVVVPAGAGTSDGNLARGVRERNVLLITSGKIIMKNGNE